LGLVTLRAKELVELADVIIYDYLSNPQILRWAKSDTEKIYAGKTAGKHALKQEEINQLLIKKSKQGKIVVRLKGGDPFVFGRGGEEAEALAQAGCPYEVVPGVSSAIAAPAYAGIPVTHRDFTQTLTVITGHEDPTKDASSVDWKNLAQNTGTRVFLMGMERLNEITSQLQKNGALPNTPTAVVRWGTTGRQQTVTGTLENICERVKAAHIGPPAVVVLGRVVELRENISWFEQKPLFGKRIVVTRTRSQTSALSGQLARAGAEVLEIPTIRIVPRKLSAAAIKKMADIKRHYDWIVFTSPNGVDIFFEHFFSVNPDVRSLAGIKFAAVGPATAAKLEVLHLQVDKQPRVFTTAHLADIFEPKEIYGKRFCLPRGNLGNPQLVKNLKKQGASVEEWIVYDTEPETLDVNGARLRYSEEGADWITFTSSSTAENWHALGLEPGLGKRPKIVSIGPVTSQTLRKLGYSVDVEAKENTINGLVEALLEAVK
jgi:uroporphyrinogen III methyltransferase/synthase